MSQIAVELIVAAFGDEHGAENAVRGLQEAGKVPAFGIYDLTVIRRDADNVLHIREMLDWDGGKGVAAGTLIGGVIGLLFPPEVLAPSLLGGTIGALAARLKENGFSDKEIKLLGATLKPGTSAMIAIVDHRSADDLEHRLELQSTKIVRQFITTNIAAQLDLEPYVKPTVMKSDRGSQVALAESLATAVEPENGIKAIPEGGGSTEIVSTEENSPQEQINDPAAIARKPDDIV